MSVGAAIGGAVFGALALAGCQTLDLDWDREKPPEKQAVVVSDPAELKLAEAAIRAEKALATLARARSAGVVPSVQTPRMVAPELIKRMTVDWLGPLETIAKQLAEEAGYDFVVAGVRPPAPVMVEVDVVDKPLILVFQDAGNQAGEAALLTVDAERMQVRLDWVDPVSAPAPAAGSGPGGS